MSEKFWAVWRANGGGAPQKRHTSRDAAIAEAGRLAQLSSENYYVLEVIGVVALVQQPVEYREITE
jgi:hypothetical protein